MTWAAQHQPHILDLSLCCTEHDGRFVSFPCDRAWEREMLEDMDGMEKGDPAYDVRILNGYKIEGLHWLSGGTVNPAVCACGMPAHEGSIWSPPPLAAQTEG